MKNDIIAFIQNQLSVYRQRDDCKELLHLSLLFLGENIGDKIKIQARLELSVERGDGCLKQFIV